MLGSGVDRIQEYSSPVCSGVDSPGQGLGKAGLELGAGGGQDTARAGMRLSWPRSTMAPPSITFCFAVKSGLFPSWSKDGKDDIGPTGL